MDQAAALAELVRRIAASEGGDRNAREAEAELCRVFAPRARLYGLRHLRDEEAARDLAQAVMLAVVEAARAGRVTEPEHVDRFVLGTCRNVAHRMRETAGRAQPTDVGEIDRLFAAPEAERLDLAALYRCIGQLDERGRTVVYLSFNQERSAEEIAATLSLTAGNVRVVRHRAIAGLRRCLDGAGGEARA